MVEDLLSKHGTLASYCNSTYWLHDPVERRYPARSLNPPAGAESGEALRTR
jgi:hypothetical protein